MTWKLDNPDTEASQAALASYVRKQFRLGKGDFTESANIAKSMVANMGTTTQYVKSGAYRPHSSTVHSSGVVHIQYAHPCEGGGFQTQVVTLTTVASKFKCSCSNRRTTDAVSCRTWCAHKLFYVADKNIDLEPLLEYAPAETQAEETSRLKSKKRAEQARVGNPKPNLVQTAKQQATITFVIHNPMIIIHL